jgi:hypothetical protein
MAVLYLISLVHHASLHFSAVFDLHGVSKKFGEWYQKTNKTEDTNKLTFMMHFRWGSRKKSTVLP